MPPEQHTPNVLKDARYIFIIAGIAILLVLGFVSFSMKSEEVVSTGQPEVPVTVQLAGTTPEEESLGGALYKKANNPLEDKLPDQTTVANPIKDVYKNPF